MTSISYDRYYCQGYGRRAVVSRSKKIVCSPGIAEGEGKGSHQQSAAIGWQVFGVPARGSGRRRRLKGLYFYIRSCHESAFPYGKKAGSAGRGALLSLQKTGLCPNELFSPSGYSPCICSDATGLFSRQTKHYPLATIFTGLRRLRVLPGML